MRCLTSTEGLFGDTFVPRFIADQIAMFERLNQLDWSDIEPSIFGTLFERVIDESKRKQLGTHYTSREDIELVVEPVLMSPLRSRVGSHPTGGRPVPRLVE